MVAPPPKATSNSPYGFPIAKEMEPSPLAFSRPIHASPSLRPYANAAAELQAGSGKLLDMQVRLT